LEGQRRNAATFLITQELHKRANSELDFGNMSSPTALFALHRAIKAGACGRHLLVAFGTGFCAYFVAIDSTTFKPRGAMSASVPCSDT
jgi:predicted naringenin-chalcone synthase